jgi:hypothetical protein
MAIITKTPINLASVSINFKQDHTPKTPRPANLHESEHTSKTVSNFR